MNARVLRRTGPAAALRAGWASCGPAIAVLFIVAMPSCISFTSSIRSNFDSLRPGMTTSQVGKAVGSPDRTVGEVTTASGQHVVVWEYDKLSSPGMKDDVYWIYIVDGFFHHYTVQGNWQQEKEAIYHTEYPRLGSPGDRRE